MRQEEVDRFGPQLQQVVEDLKRVGAGIDHGQAAGEDALAAGAAQVTHPFHHALVAAPPLMVYPETVVDSGRPVQAEAQVKFVCRQQLNPLLVQ